MGCANVLQKESIKQKEIDLNCEIIKPNHIETNDTIRKLSQIFMNLKILYRKIFKLIKKSNLQLINIILKMKKLFLDLFSMYLKDKLKIIKKEKMYKN